MCKLRTYRHKCGHITHRPISTCRFTFASNARALCQAGPELTISLPDDCRACLYQAFCDTWEDRIADARSRQSNARMQLRDIMLQEPEDEHAWGGFHDGTETHACYTDCADSARRKRDECDHEVETLWAKYQREQWAHWRPLVTGPNHNTESPNKQRLRRRRTGSRCSGDSPLRHVTSASEHPDTDLELRRTTTLEEEYTADDEEEEMEEGEGAPSFGSSDGDSGEEDDEDSKSSGSPRTPPGSQENLATLRNWAWPPKATEYQQLPLTTTTSSPASSTSVHEVGQDAMQGLRDSLKQWNSEIVVAGGDKVGVVRAQDDDLQLPAW